MHGKVCFTGTRIPVTDFFDNLADGMGSQEFLDEYPSVTWHQVSVILDWMSPQTHIISKELV